jgi:hypothetical protein
MVLKWSKNDTNFKKRTMVLIGYGLYKLRFKPWLTQEM